MRDLILRNFWLKLASLVLATLIWLTVQATLNKESVTTYKYSRPADEPDKYMGLSKRVEKRLEVPVRVQSNGTNLPAFRTVPNRVSVTLSGDASYLNEVNLRELEAYVEVGDQPNIHDLYPVQVAAPSHLSWQRVLPFVVKVQSAREFHLLPGAGAGAGVGVGR